ncbi:hypothetical protein SLS60_000382 [Paraconiothyrium brasiliense]|uniref:Cytochrome P450 n=1 Tax=Paraconiothyrium brasiliense TaxID=300254 RepID=A0ABR3S641_9PLEO
MGHLSLIRDAILALPPHCAPDIATSNVAKEFEGGIFYLDLMPFERVNLIVTSANAAAQLSRHAELMKPRDVVAVIRTLCGGDNLVTMPKTMWKPWRTTFNRAFSDSSIRKLVPMVAGEVEKFCCHLSEQAKTGRREKLEDLIGRLTIGIIVSMCLGPEFCSPVNKDRVSTMLKSQLDWTSFSDAGHPLRQLNPVRPFILWFNKQRMHNLIGPEIDKQYTEIQRGIHSSETFKPIVALALEEYAESVRKEGKSIPQKLDSAFKATLIAQAVILLIAGQDPTTTPLVFCLHLLYTHKAALARLRSELDEVFGIDASPSHITALLQHDPQRLNSSPFILAIIKETLRLYPPLSIVRDGQPGLTLTDDAGTVFPTEGCKIWVLHSGMQRNPKYFLNPDDFLPERWLAQPGDPLYPLKEAWRPFEFGPRTCIGQPLAVLEMKIVLLMLARNFEIEAAYGEGQPREMRPGEDMSRCDGLRSEKAPYPTFGQGLATRPNDGYPFVVGTVDRH